MKPIRYEVAWPSEIDSKREQYNQLKPKSKEARQLRKEINAMASAENLKQGRKIYNRI